MPVECRLFDEIGRRAIIDVYVAVGSTEAEIRREIGKSVPGPMLLRAMIDTGAGQSVVSLDKLKELGLDPVGIDRIKVSTVTTGDAPEEMSVYAVDVAINGVRPGAIAEDLRILGAPKIDGIRADMLLGRDILERCLLVYDGPNRRFTLAFDAINH